MCSKAQPDLSLDQLQVPVALLQESVYRLWVLHFPVVPEGITHSPQSVRPETTNTQSHGHVLISGNTLRDILLIHYSFVYELLSCL